jgi:hypothetical protein
MVLGSHKSSHSSQWACRQIVSVASVMPKDPTRQDTLADRLQEFVGHCILRARKSDCAGGDQRQLHALGERY